MDERVRRDLPPVESFIGVPPSYSKAERHGTHNCLSRCFGGAINATLVQEVEKEEQPVNYINRVFHGVEVMYKMIEKVALALVIIA